MVPIVWFERSETLFPTRPDMATILPIDLGKYKVSIP
jgi:hypothetical protein